MFSHSADEGLSLGGKLLWLATNSVRSLAGEARAVLSGRPRIDHPADVFPGPLHYDEPSGRASLESSPGRLLAIHTTLGLCRLLNEILAEPVSVLDLGCGSGGFYPFFRDQLTRFSHYTGVDIARHPAWEEHEHGGEGRATFACSPAERFVDALDERSPYNLIHSNCALEHMQDDEHVIRTLCDWSRSQVNPIAQFHVLPATAALPLYRSHGYRVYSTSDVKRLRCSSGQSFVIGLGGWRSWSQHFLHLRSRGSLSSDYGKRLEDACAQDVVSGGTRLPIMWCLLNLSRLTIDRGELQ